MGYFNFKDLFESFTQRKKISRKKRHDILPDTANRREGRLPYINANIFGRGLNGYLNYCCYEICGIRTNSKGGKKKVTIKINTLNEEGARQQALSSGLSDPLTISICEFKEPTVQQLEYANDLGITVPDDACNEDVCCMISRVTEEDEKSPPTELALYADRKGTQFSAFMGEKAFLNMLFFKLERRDKMAFFAYAVYSYLAAKPIGDLDTSSLSPLFYRFADEFSTDPAILSSLNKYNGSALVEFGTYSGKTYTAVYNSAAKFIVKFINSKVNV